MFIENIRKLFEHEPVYTTIEVATMIGITKSAVCAAIMKKKLKAVKVAHRLYITESEIKRYCDNRYNRLLSEFGGKPLFDMEKGEYSVLKAAELLGVKRHILYHLLKVGKMPAYKRGAAYIIRKEDLEKAKFWIAQCRQMAQ